MPGTLPPPLRGERGPFRASAHRQPLQPFAHGCRKACVEQRKSRETAQRALRQCVGAGREFAVRGSAGDDGLDRLGAVQAGALFEAVGGKDGISARLRHQCEQPLQGMGPRWRRAVRPPRRTGRRCAASAGPKPPRGGTRTSNLPPFARVTGQTGADRVPGRWRDRARWRASSSGCRQDAGPAAATIRPARSARSAGWPASRPRSARPFRRRRQAIPPSPGPRPFHRRGAGISWCAVSTRHRKRARPPARRGTAGCPGPCWRPPRCENPGSAPNPARRSVRARMSW